MRPLPSYRLSDSFEPHLLHAAITELLEEVSRDIILPRFRALPAHHITEKSPGELVTIADHEAEALLSERLAILLPEARVVGEEAACADPTLLERLDSGVVWLIDPIDGTANFAGGNAPFGVMIALVCDGLVNGGWLYDPLNERLCHARLGHGAFINDVPVRIGQRSTPRPVASLATQFMTPEIREAVEAQFAEDFDLVAIPRCAAEHYPRLTLGDNQLALFQRTLPWDHAAGALFLTEAGGHVSRWDGSPYQLRDGKPGIIAASNQASWRSAIAMADRLGLPDLNIDASFSLR